MRTLLTGSLGGILAGSLMLIALFMGPLMADAGEPEEDVLLDRSRVVTKKFAQTLQAELMNAMSGGGPPEAIRVCRDRAGQIADEIARESGARVGRTSLKFRNPQNMPAAWQLPVLRDFDDEGSNAVADRLEKFEIAPEDGVKARYMSAIITKPMCLACHGDPKGPVAEVLEANYPHDRAIGYEAGDIRGAFYVIWPEEILTESD